METKNLFEKFISGKEEIVPAVTNDWRLIPTKIKHISSVCLFSEKLQQEIVNVDVYMLLDTLQINNTSILTTNNELYITGNYIIGKDRQLYTEDYYNVYTRQMSILQSNIIPNHALEAGYEYEDEDGAVYVYLGHLYYSLFKGLTDDAKLKTTKVAKKHFYVLKQFVSFFCTNSEVPLKIVPTVSKLIKKLDKHSGKLTIENIFNPNRSYVYLSHNKPMNPSILAIKEYPIAVEKNRLEVTKKNCLLKAKLNGEYYTLGRINDLAQISGYEHSYRIRTRFYDMSSKKYVSLFSEDTTHYCRVVLEHNY